MTTLDLTVVAKALAAAAATITTPAKLRCFHYPKLQISPPQFQVRERTTMFDESMGRGLDAHTFICQLLVAPESNDRDGAELLDAYLKPDGPTSVRQALTRNGGAAADRTLGGICQGMRVIDVEAYAIYQVGGIGYLGAQFRVAVW